MNEPFDLREDSEPLNVLAQATHQEAISIDIHVEYIGAIPPQRMLSLPARPYAWTRFVAAFKTILGLPKPIGRLVFDILGRHDIADSSSIILGWFVIWMAILLFHGFIPIDALLGWLISKR